MVFSSITFLFYFLPVVFALYFLVPDLKAKNFVLLLASLFFYAWGEPVYVILMLLSIIGNFFLGKFLAEGREEKGIRKYFVLAVIWNILILFFFKYTNMLIGLVNSVTHWNLRLLKMSLPIGISFYTFQILSYVIDVYRGKVKPQKSFISFALYVTMFPQLIAGPIVKYGDIEQALTERRITLAGAGKGAERFIFGLAKKVLLANSLGAIFTQISSMAADGRTVLLVWIGALSYAFQIYFDFSGYSDMAIGLGQAMGFKFPENFNYPYIATSVTDFWRRWHISLSSWFRDYVYIPLGGNRVKTWKHIRNLLIVWALTGLWHGASWNFVLWGLYYALWLILEKYVFGKFLEKHQTAGRILTGFIVLFGWVLFAFTDFKELSVYFLQMFGVGAAGVFGTAGGWYFLMTVILLLLSALFSTPLPMNFYRGLMRKAKPACFAVLLVLFILCTAYLVYQSYNPFLYFRF